MLYKKVLNSFISFCKLIAFFSIINLAKSQNPCLNGGVLVSRPAASVDQVCICQKSFIGTKCETKLDTLSVVDKRKYGCELRPCWIGSTCEDRDGSFICHCSANTFGEFCEQSSLTNNDPCISKPCFNYGRCVQQDQNSYTCACNGTYGGLSCKQNLVGACSSNPCLRDGICIPVGLNDYRCQCPDWTIGKNCEVVFNPCSRVNCMNNANCLKRRTLAYECNCTTDFTGLQCDQPKAQTCISTRCAYGSCQLNINGQYGCVCSTGGYEGPFCEIERCSPRCVNGYCNKDTSGNFYCVCSSSYKGSACSELVCFSGSTNVETLERGVVKISDLRQGDYLKTYDLNAKKWIFSKFVTYLHKNEKTVGKFLSIQTSGNKTLTLSPLHFIARINPKHASKPNIEEFIEYVFARNLKINDYLITPNSGQNGLSLDLIVKIETIFDMGVYAPLTESGTLAVNSIFASCYANTLWHNLAHLFFYPIIQISKYINIDALNQYMENAWSQLNNEDDKTMGIFWYAKFFHSIVDYIPFSSSLVAF